MRLKRIIAAICAAAMLPITYSLPLHAAEETTARAVSFTGWAQLRAETNDYDKYVAGNSTVIKTSEDTIQIFSNKDDNPSNQSQCGAYFQYEVPSNWKDNDTITLTLTLTDTSKVADELYVIAAGTENAGKSGSSTYTIDNVWKDVQSAYKASDKTSLNAAPTGKAYSLDITALAHTGTNALYVYSRDQMGRIYYVKNASITYHVWSAKSEAGIWSLSSTDRINGYANTGNNNSITTHMAADDKANLYETDASVKSAYDSAEFKYGTPALNANYNIMGMIARAGNASTHIFKKGVTYTLHYTLSGSWENASAASPNGAYLNVSTWTLANTRIDNKTNLNVTSKSSETPVNKTYAFTPSQDCYAEFIFELRRVIAGGDMTVSDLYVTADSVNGLPDEPDGPTPDPDATPKPIPDVKPPAGKAWSEIWSYDFNSFKSTSIHSSSNRPTLSGAYPNQPPTISWYDGQATSAHGILGRDADDYHFVIKSVAKRAEPLRLLYDLDNLGVIDTSYDCLVSSVDVAFTTTNERRYIGSYRIAGTPYNAVIFDADGYMKYWDNNGRINYIKDGNNNIKYNANEWYNITIRYDFKNNQVQYFIDSENKAEHPMLTNDSDVKYQFEEISYKSVMDAANPGTAYLDNLALYKEQNVGESHITASITAPSAKTYMTGTEIEIAGKTADGSADGGTMTTTVYLDNAQIAQTTGSSYAVKKSDIAPGKHTVKAVTNTSNNETVEREVSFKVANYQMPATYADGMVLQRNKEINIAGLAVDGKEISVSLNGITKTATAQNGKFSVKLPAQSASKSTTLSISSEGVTTEYKTAIGEVILCSGQSNMAYTLGRFSNLHPLWDKDYPDIHLFKQDNARVSEVQTDIPSGRWVGASKIEALNFSGFGYGMGRYLYEALNEDIPIGLVYAAIGGTSINIWVPKGAYDNDPDLYAVRNNGSTAYNAMIAPLTDYTFGSAVWYQGEADSYAKYNYEKMLTRYIDSTREALNDSELPFAIVLIPIFNYQGQYGIDRQITGVREGEWKVSQMLDHVVTVVGIDTGNYSDIHPDDKAILCQRASTVLQHFISPDDSSIQYLSPSPISFEQNGDSMIITFKDTYGGLKTKDNENPRGFKVAGDDNNYIDTTAAISGDTIIVDTSAVTGAPKVRYAWEDAPAREGNTSTLNLVNNANLPSPPFRSDNDKYRYNTSGETVNFVPMIRNITSETNKDGSTDIIVNVRDYDDDEIQSVEVFVDGTSIGTTSTKIKGSETEYVLNYVGATAGTHKVYAIATDTNGGISTKQDSKLGNISVEPYQYRLKFEETPDPAPDVEYITPLEPFIDKITIEKAENKLIITPINHTELQPLVLYTAIYHEDKTLKSVTATECEAENGILTAPIEKPVITENETYKMFLWTAEYEPVIMTITE